jgi:hypothetical protein
VSPVARRSTGSADHVSADNRTKLANGKYRHPALACLATLFGIEDHDLVGDVES